MKYRHHRNSQKSASWAGLLLGFLLMLFLGAFLYVGFLFFNWGKSTVSALPEMGDLPLPKLVHAAPEPPVSGEAPAAPVLSLPGPQEQSAQEQLPEKRLTVLIMGVDNRPDEKVENTRTDTIMVLTVNPKTGATGMLSLPRDMLINVPALHRSAKVNTVHVLGYLNRYPGGGPAMLKDTVASMLGYPIDYYMRVNFDGFRQIVDLLGGIDINVPKAIHDPLYPDNNYGYEGFDIEAGPQHLDGATALKYARTRHADSDYGRANRQQEVILAIKEKLTQPGQLAALLPRIPALSLALANSIQTDMPVDRAIAFARIMDKADLKNPTRVVVDQTFGTQDANDPTFGFVLKPDAAKLHSAAVAIFADAPNGQTPDQAQKLALKKEGARVVVLNGSPEQGLASKTAAALSSDGFNVVAVGNAQGGDNPRTALITYGDSDPVTREALLQRFNITSERIQFEPPSPDADLALVLGADLVAQSLPQ